MKKTDLLISVTDKIVTWAFGDKTDDQYDYEQALYHNMLGEAKTEEIQFMSEFEQHHPVDAVDSREDMKILMQKRNGNLNCIDKLRFVKPNRHVGSDIFSHFFTGCYEHKDENGNWVEGPALGHGYEGGYDYTWSPEKFAERVKDKIFGKGETNEGTLQAAD